MIKHRALDTPVLPASIDAERFVLGSILLGTQFPEGISKDHFSLEPHRRIFRCMSDLRARGEHIDRVTVANELDRHGERESVGGLSYLVGLDDGLPNIPNLESYLRILQEIAARRRLIFGCQHLMNRAALGSENLSEVMQAGQDLFTTAASTGRTYRSIEDIPCIAECGAAEIEYIRPELPRGTVVAITGDAQSGKSTLATAWARDAWRNNGLPSLFLDRENPLAVIADRLARLGFEDGPGLRIWGGWLPSEAPQPDSPLVRAWARQHKGLIVVDSFSAFIEGDQNDAAIVRAFMHRCRRLADLGASLLIIHHDGKAESAKDYRGSSDFKAAIDQGYHVASFGADGRLDKLVLRPFKSRIGNAAEISYEYAGGRLLRGDVAGARQTVTERLTAILRLNPAVTGSRFDELAGEQSISRAQARTFLQDGVISGFIDQKTGAKNAKRYSLKSREAGLAR